MNNKNTGKEYEKIVAVIHKQFSGNADLSENIKVKGKSGTERRIDIAIRSQVVGYEVLIIVQCKDYKRRVDIEKVDSLIGTLQVINASKGILVSDSGFSSGAIKRAKQDGRVELVSVVDVENEKLRARIGIPVVADIIRVKSMGISINERSVVATSFDSQMLNEAKDRFAHLWNMNSLDSDEGDHDYTDVAIDVPEQHREIVYHYSVEKLSSFKEIGLEKGLGIYNVLDKSFRSKSITTDKIEFKEIMETWREATDENKQRAFIRFALYTGLPELK